jgi:hypothetical protein
VPSIQEADVLLELHDYSFKFWDDGTPVQEWWFIIRHLGEASPERAIHRFIFTVPGPVGESTRLLSQRLPVVLSDVCLGLLPKPWSSEVGRR